MNYYYDLTLNFDMENLWEFYEWEETDLLSDVKKIPLFRVNFETMKDFLVNHIKVCQSFVNDIAHKTIFRDMTEDVFASFLISDSKNSLAVMINEEGYVIALSKLLIVDDNNINEYIYTLMECEIPYEVLGLREKKTCLRQEEKLKHFIKVELQTLMDSENVQKLQYLYYEWFQQEEECIDKMYHDMISYLSKPMDEKLEKISYLIQLSYHQV